MHNITKKRLWNISGENKNNLAGKKALRKAEKRVEKKAEKRADSLEKLTLSLNFWRISVVFLTICTAIYKKSRIKNA